MKLEAKEEESTCLDRGLLLNVEILHKNWQEQINRVRRALLKNTCQESIQTKKRQMKLEAKEEENACLDRELLLRVEILHNYH